jgi:hypothetical protein
MELIRNTIKIYTIVKSNYFIYFSARKQFSASFNENNFVFTQGNHDNNTPRMNMNVSNQNFINPNSNMKIETKPLTNRPKQNRHRNSELIFPISNLINYNNNVNSLKLEDVKFYLILDYFWKR